MLGGRTEASRKSTGFPSLERKWGGGAPRVEPEWPACWGQAGEGHCALVVLKAEVRFQPIAATRTPRWAAPGRRKEAAGNPSCALAAAGAHSSSSSSDQKTCSSAI